MSCGVSSPSLSGQVVLQSLSRACLWWSPLLCGYCPAMADACGRRFVLDSTIYDLCLELSDYRFCFVFSFIAALVLYITYVQCDSFPFPALQCSQWSPPLLSLRRGSVELPSGLVLSASQGVRLSFKSRSSTSLKETCTLISHPNSIIGSIGLQWRAVLSLYCRFGLAVQDVPLIAPLFLQIALSSRE